MGKKNGKHIVIVGAGTIGGHIAEMLQTQSIDVVLVDRRRGALDDVGENLDVQMLHGNGADPEVLERAGVQGCSLLMALTDADELNLLVASIAKTMGASKVIARVRSPWCSDTSRINLRGSLGIDLLMNPEMLTAIEIVKFLDNPDALALAHYAHGKVQLRQLILDPRSRFCGRALKDCDIPQGALVVVRVRGEEVIIPHGEDRLEAGDKLTLIGPPGRLDEIQKLFHAPSAPARHVVVAGGGNSGYFLARTLEQRNFKVKVIESDADRCDYLSENLSGSTVILGNMTRLGFLKEERIDLADVFIAVTGEDEDNLMACLLAKKLGVKQTVARIKRPDYASLVQQMGVDLALSPRHVLAERVTALIMGGKIQALSLLEQGRVEVIEFLAEGDPPAQGVALKELKMPRGAIISSIVRQGQAIVPRGDDAIRPGDRVVVAGLREAMDEAEKLFQARA